MFLIWLYSNDGQYLINFVCKRKLCIYFCFHGLDQFYMKLFELRRLSRDYSLNFSNIFKMLGFQKNIFKY